MIMIDEKQIGELNLLPLNSYVLVKPFDENPFRKMTISKEGIITRVDKPEVYNNDTGEIEEANLVEQVGVVVEVSPLCRNKIKRNDYVIYRSGQGLPVPLFGTDYEVLAEQSILLVITDENDERVG